MKAKRIVYSEGSNQVVITLSQQEANELEQEVREVGAPTSLPHLHALRRYLARVLRPGEGS